MNDRIIQELYKLANYEKNNNQFKYNAYKKAYESIQNFSQEITLSNIGEIKKLEGIGKGIFQRIEEILQSNPLPLTPRDPPTQENNLLQTLTNIYGIGPAKARDLIEKNNISSLEQLVNQQDTLLNEKQKIGLKYYESLLKRIPRQEMDLHNKFIRGIWGLESSKNKFTFEVTGSYRRGEMTSGDIDILLTFEERENLMGRLIYSLRKNKYILETLAEGSKKFMGIAKLPNCDPRRIDIIWAPPREYPFALLYFTGSEKYNRNMREHARKLGYKLNEKSLIPLPSNSSPIPIPKFQTEEDIHIFLNLPYLLPQHRLP